MHVRSTLDICGAYYVEISQRYRDVNVRALLCMLSPRVAKTQCAVAERYPGQEKERAGFRETGKDESNGSRAARTTQPMPGGAVCRDAKPPRAGRLEMIIFRPKLAGARLCEC